MAIFIPKSFNDCNIGPAVNFEPKKVFSVSSISKYSGARPVLFNIEAIFCKHCGWIMNEGGRLMGRTLHLTHTQYEVLHGLVEDIVNDMPEDVVEHTETFKIYQKLQSMRHK